MFVKSIYAGIMIGLGGIAYLAVQGGLLGAFLFSIGLISVIEFDLNLYTGKVADFENYKLNLFLILNNPVYVTPPVR